MKRISLRKLERGGRVKVLLSLNYDSSLQHDEFDSRVRGGEIRDV